MKQITILSLVAIVFLTFAFKPTNTLKLALLKYSGGGDWYANPTALPNLARFCKDKLGIPFEEGDFATVEVGSAELFNYPFVHMTGHGNVVFSAAEAENLRNYLIGGGFLHIDDNYGMQPYVVKELKKIFPNKELIELPVTHPIFNSAFSFPQGLPKIHEHDGLRPQAMGIFVEARLVLLFTFES